MENIVLLISIGFFSYELVKHLMNQKILSKVNHYITDKSEKYYDEYIKRIEKNQKVDLKERLNLIYRINLIIEKA